MEFRGHKGDLRPRLAALICAALLPACEAELSPAAEDQSAPVGERPALRVRVAEVREGRVNRRAAVSGIVHAFRKATIAAEVNGRVVERKVEPGDRVIAGQALLSIDATRLRLAVDEARANLQARAVDRDEARGELERGDRLAGEDTISQSRHDALRFALERAESAHALARVALRSARRELADSSIEAPFAGTVDEVHADVGDFLAAGAPVATLVDLARVRLRAGVVASEAAALELGGEAPVFLEALGGTQLTGEVRSVGSVADPSSGTYPVELWLDNQRGLLREGMVASVQLPQAPGGPRALVPRAALIRRDGRMSLFVVHENGEGSLAVARPVRVGRSDGETVEILEGAQVGDRVVIDGLFALRDGAAVRVEGDAHPGT